MEENEAKASLLKLTFKRKIFILLNMKNLFKRISLLPKKCFV